MASRTVTDVEGRTWTCTSDAVAATAEAAPLGRDVRLSCETASVAGPVSVTVGWKWQSISEPGLARIIAEASPVPRR